MTEFWRRLRVFYHILKLYKKISDLLQRIVFVFQTAVSYKWCSVRRRRVARSRCFRRITGDIIEIFNIIHQKYDASCSPVLQFNNRVDTRGNKYKLLNKSFHYGIRKYSFTARAINTWNNLPNSIVDAESVNIFKIRLDKYWSHQPLQYDLKPK